MDSQAMKLVPDTPRSNRPDSGKSSTSNTKARDITYFKCRGKGHYVRDCPNQWVMILTPEGGYESQDEEKVLEATDAEEEVAYPEMEIC